jgi:SAM-dependent methyltransferase
MGKTVGETVAVTVGDHFPAYRPGDMITVKRSRLSRRAPDPPRQGRFYPKGLLNHVTGVFPQNIEPFRCINVQNGHMEADLNHPLAQKQARLEATILGIDGKKSERGGTVIDWLEAVSEGPGMQARWSGAPTDFFSDDPFGRDDEAADGDFYREPRFVQHLDSAAVDVVSSLYGRLVGEGSRVLDLMSSWTSHLPENLRVSRLTGLGMNMAELEKNSRLTDRTVHDLNKNPALPYPSDAFDTILCTVSVEYLVHPEAVFDELARVLRPGGIAVMTFSNRWFPPKSIRIWKELHEFERMGLVLEYFERTGRFQDLETFSMRGIPRPWDDKYFPQMRFSDPVYAVWGRKRV